jgi:hypothetical protein
MSKKTLLHISEKPWGEISEADYTLEQWHNACLIHLHDGPPTSKSQCKLPVKTPNGSLNRNGVHAAAAALAGARSPLKAPPEQKAKAAAALRRYYSQLDEEPPESLMEHTDSVENVLSHYGKKGMKWGVRNRSIDVSRSMHPDALRAQRIGQIRKASGLKALSNDDLQTYAQRLQLEQNVKRLTSNETSSGKKFSTNLISRVGNNLASDIATKATKEIGKGLLAFAMSRGVKKVGRKVLQIS